MACSLEKTYRSSSHENIQAYSNPIYRAIPKGDYKAADHLASLENIKEFLGLSTGIRVLLSTDSQKKDPVAQNWLITQLKKQPTLITGQLFSQAAISNHIFFFLFTNHYEVLVQDIMMNGSKNIKSCFEKILERNDKQQCLDLCAKLEEGENDDPKIRKSIEIGKKLIESHVEKKLSYVKKNLIEPTVLADEEVIVIPEEDSALSRPNEKHRSPSSIQNEIKKLVANVLNETKSEESLEKIKDYIENYEFDLYFFIDDEKNTLFHFACRWLYVDLLDVLLSHALPDIQLNSHGKGIVHSLADGVKEIAKSQYDKGYNDGVKIGKSITKMKSEINADKTSNEEE